MELILDKNKKREHLYLEVFHYYRELIMEKKLPPGSRNGPLFENVRRN